MLHTIAIVENDTIVDCFIAEDEFAAQVLAERADAEEVSGDPCPSVGWIRADGLWRFPPPFPSWIWTGDNYQPPVPYPNDGGDYEWNEASQEWVRREGP